MPRHSGCQQPNIPVNAPARPTLQLASHASHYGNKQRFNVNCIIRLFQLTCKLEARSHEEALRPKYKVYTPKRESARRLTADQNPWRAST